MHVHFLLLIFLCDPAILLSIVKIRGLWGRIGNEKAKVNTSSYKYEEDCRTKQKANEVDIIVVDKRAVFSEDGNVEVKQNGNSGCP